MLHLHWIYSKNLPTGRKGVVRLTRSFVRSNFYDRRSIVSSPLTAVTIEHVVCTEVVP